MLATAVLQCDHKQWERDGLTLPTVAHASGPVPDGVEVCVTSTQIVVGNRTVARIDAGEVDPDSIRHHLITPLLEALKEEAEKRDAFATGYATGYAAVVRTLAVLQGEGCYAENDCLFKTPIIAGARYTPTPGLRGCDVDLAEPWGCLSAAGPPARRSLTLPRH